MIFKNQRQIWKLKWFYYFIPGLQFCNYKMNLKNWYYTDWLIVLFDTKEETAKLGMAMRSCRHMLVIPALRKLRQESCHEFETSLTYMENIIM